LNTTQVERNRVLSLLSSSIRRLDGNKGRGWRAELDRLYDDIWKGTAFLWGEGSGGETQQVNPNPSSPSASEVVVEG
jgi:hypothetical protein